MADFQKYAPKLSKLEGGFSNRKADRGGPTNRGVTLRTFREFYGSDKTVEDLRNMTDEQWTHIMKSGYWDKCKADEIKSQSVAEFFSDWCVNSGTGMIRKIQFLLGVRIRKCRLHIIQKLSKFISFVANAKPSVCR